MARCRVLIAEDEPRTLQLLKQIVDRNSAYAVVGAAMDGIEAVDLCERTLPDLVLMDLKLPRMSGIAAIAQISARFPNVRCLALTTITTPDVLTAVLRAGGAGYVVKAAPPTELFDAMATVLDEERRYAISAVMVQAMAASLADAQSLSNETVIGDRVERLSTRELELVGWLARGLSNREIAARMFVSEGTVKAYLGSACRRLDVRDRMQLLIRCCELGLVRPGLIPDQAKR